MDASYCILTGLHASLLLSSLLIPHLLPINADVRSSRDRPPHPLVLPLVANPTATVACVCLGVAVVQAGWGWWMRRWSRAGESEGPNSGSVWRRTRDAWLVTLGGTLLVFPVVILFGAPLNSHHIQTYLLSLLFSLLTIYTPTYVIGAPFVLSPPHRTSSQTLMRQFTWIRLYAELSPKTPIERALVYPVVGTAMGCWTGVIPIALDWDRPWQAWPLTPALGALVGYVLGALGAVARSLVEVVVRRIGERGLGEPKPGVVKAKRKVKKGKVKIKKLE